MKKHRFVKEGSGWYIELPEYLEQGGSKGDLAMVAGADTLLDLVSEGGDSVTVLIDTVPFEGADELERIRISAASLGGADYRIRYYKGEALNRELWLCDVTLFVFGDLPERIYIRNV